MPDTKQSPRNEFYDEDELSKEFGWSVHTLRKWRSMRRGPPFVRRGGIWYPKDGVVRWLRSDQKVVA